MKAIKLIIERYSHGEKQTIGSIIGVSEVGHERFRHDTLELPWLDNQKNISCIPIGRYKLKKRFSKKYKHHLHIQDVENRTWVLIHAGNYYTDILGCVLVGSGLKDINHDGVVDVVSSKKTLKSIMNSVEFDEKNEIDLEIFNI